MILQINHQTIDLQKILEPETTIPILEANEQTALQFCIDWLKGKEEFTLKTSGSTGTPKNISLKRQNMQWSAKATIKALQLQNVKKALICLPTQYIAGTMMLVRALEHHWDIYLTTPKANPLEQLPQNYQPDFTALVPTQLTNILQNTHTQHIAQKMQSILIGGAAIEETLIEQCQSIKTPIYSSYGMTETISHIALRRINGAEKTNYYITLPQVDIDQDERQCLKIKAQVTDNEWITTNDIVEVLPQKQGFRLLGRADNIINTGGIKIQPETIEKKIAHFLPPDTPFFITAIADSYWGNKVVLLIQSSQTIDLNTIKEKLKPILLPHEMPKEIHLFSPFLYTETGKIQRKTTTEAFLKTTKKC
ncbi:MAG: acyl-CoA synthetase [Cytophagales bacterium]|nr:MAG: acyl-CoA synthetase [Cytophagales bacterium]